jgi:ribosomal protein L4
MSDPLDTSTTDASVVVHLGGATVFGAVGLPVPPTVRLGLEPARDLVARAVVPRARARASGRAASRTRPMTTGARGTYAVAAGGTLAVAR